jgi:hypothetical protein
MNTVLKRSKPSWLFESRHTQTRDGSLGAYDQWRERERMKVIAGRCVFCRDKEAIDEIRCRHCGVIDPAIRERDAYHQLFVPEIEYMNSHELWPEYCCEALERLAELDCDIHEDKWECPDVLFHKYKNGSTGIIIHDGGQSAIDIKYCPFCGARQGR